MKEMLYHVDKNDKVIGKIDRSRAHKEKVLHRSGMIFITNRKKEVFIQFRADKETFPNCYDASSTFHVAYGESYEQAARRELNEELSIKTKLIKIGKFLHEDPPEYQIVAVFLGATTKEPKVNESEAYGGSWFSLKGLKNVVASGKITPWLRDGYKIFRQKVEK